MKFALIVAIAGCIAVAAGKVYFQETFDEGWEDRWVMSEAMKKEGKQGAFKLSKGPYAAQAGLSTTQDARFYQASALFDELSNEGDDLVIQFTVAFPQTIDCGGGYLKIGYWDPEEYDGKKFHGETAYKVMFGPDVCGYSTKKVHAIFNYKEKNLDKKEEIKLVTESTDLLTHLYTLIVHPDLTYEVEVDGKNKAKGNVMEDWDFLPPKMIKDPSISKPSDWMDAEEIDDPEDVKPEGWDDIEPEIEDPDAEMPDDWDEELDGEWEAPLTPNPEYKGEWRPSKIPNPEYKGVWVHPEIENPDYYTDDKVVTYDALNFVAVDVWQVKSGTIFDSIIITNDVKEAKAFADETFYANKDEEKAAKDKADEVKRERERKEAEEREEERERQEELERLEDDEDDEEWDDEDEEDDDL